MTLNSWPEIRPSILIAPRWTGHTPCHRVGLGCDRVIRGEMTADHQDSRYPSLISRSRTWSLWSPVWRSPQRCHVDRDHTVHAFDVNWMLSHLCDLFRIDRSVERTLGDDQTTNRLLVRPLR